MKIRKYADADFDFIAALWKDMFDVTFPGKEFNEEIQMKTMKKDLKIMYVVEENGERIGMFGLEIRERPYGKKAKIRHIAVKKEFRGRGFGTQILQEIEKKCRKKGVKIIEARIGIPNKVSLALFENQGFEKIFYVVWKNLDLRQK